MMRKPVLILFLFIVAIYFISCDEAVVPKLLPVVSTTEVSTVSFFSAQSGGVVSADGGSEVIARGVCWSIFPNPDIKGSKTVDSAGTGTFVSTIDSLRVGTTYYLRAYATSKAGTSYGNEVQFRTLSTLAEVTTAAITSITDSSAISGGTVLHDGGEPVLVQGVCWDTLPAPTIKHHKSMNGNENSSFVSSIPGLKSGTQYYVRAYVSTTVGIAYGNELNFTSAIGLPELSTSVVSILSDNSVSTGGRILHDGGGTILSKGVCWGTKPLPTVNRDAKTSDGSGNDPFTCLVDGLDNSTTYYLRSYATNEIGVGYGNQLSFQIIGTVINPVTGRTWMDKNLGALRVAKRSDDAESYGDLYQWGRGKDGHEQRNSPTTTTLSESDSPGHGYFIVKPGYNRVYDWRSEQNNMLWQGADGVNNPCPEGFRVPTFFEWVAEHKTWRYSTPHGAFSSTLKLPVAGYREFYTGSIVESGASGKYWSSTTGQTTANDIQFFEQTVLLYEHERANGYSVRCIKE